MMHQRVEQATRLPGGGRKQAIGIQAFLEWAFSVEHARLNFDDLDRDAPPAVGTEYRLLQRHVLGCSVDGGGQSAPAPDAEYVADRVANLPPEVGGRSMAIIVAEHARAGMAPDWMPGAAPQVVPRQWHSNRHGRHGKSEVIGEARVRTRKGIRRYPMRAVPITYSPSLAQIHAARRAYLQWWGALLHLRVELQCWDWKRHQITEAMPPMAPWKRFERNRLTKS